MLRSYLISSQIKQPKKKKKTSKKCISFIVAIKQFDIIKHQYPISIPIFTENYLLQLMNPKEKQKKVPIEKSSTRIIDLIRLRRNRILLLNHTGKIFSHITKCNTYK